MTAPRASEIPAADRDIRQRRPNRSLKPLDAPRAVELMRAGNSLSAIVNKLSVGRGRIREIREVGEAAGLVFDPATACMIDPAGPQPVPLAPRALARALGISPADLAWQDSALCAETDPEAFFPEKGGSTRAAKRVCMNCEVRDECLGYAQANGISFGIWGGLSERERRRLRRQAA
jgi:WhiB family transcriptional regulator, redox-sensing transcriptional regulator